MRKLNPTATDEQGRRDMSHRFKIGQSVRVKNVFPDQTGGGIYEVTRLMPETPDGERHYRIKGRAGVERAVSEAQLEAAG